MKNIPYKHRFVGNILLDKLLLLNLSNFNKKLLVLVPKTEYDIRVHKNIHIIKGKRGIL